MTFTAPHLGIYPGLKTQTACLRIYLADPFKQNMTIISLWFLKTCLKSRPAYIMCNTNMFEEECWRGRGREVFDQIKASTKRRDWGEASWLRYWLLDIRLFSDSVHIKLAVHVGNHIRINPQCSIRGMDNKTATMSDIQLVLFLYVGTRAFAANERWYTDPTE